MCWLRFGNASIRVLSIVLLQHVQDRSAETNALRKGPKAHAARAEARSSNLPQSFKTNWVLQLAPRAVLQ